MDHQLINLGITEKGGKAFVSSRDIARVFEKNHQHVITIEKQSGAAPEDFFWGFSFVISQTWQ